MVKIILLTGIEALNLYLCIYLAYILLKEKEEESGLKQKVIWFLIYGAAVLFNSTNLPTLYYNNAIWIQTDLLLMLVFKFRKGRHNFVRCGIAILILHLTIYMDYAIGFLFIAIGNHYYKSVLYGEKIEVIGTFFTARIILFIAIIMLLPKIKGRFSDLRQTKRALVIVDMVSYMGVLLLQQLFTRNIQHLYVNGFYVTLAMGIILCIVFYAYDSMINRRERERLIDATNKLVQENYQKLYNEQKRLEHTAHDFKNHIFLLTKYLEEGKIDEAIAYGRKLTNPLEVLVQRSWSGNKIVDTILNTKLSEAEDKRIQVYMEVDHMAGLPLTDYDICTVISNLFDNAIEACEQIKKDHKEIYISVKESETLYILKFVNSMEEQPQKNFQTTKKDKEVHGIGLESVRSCLDKYQGTLVLDYTENQFTAIASIMKQRNIQKEEKKMSIETDKKVKSEKRGKLYAEHERVRWGFKSGISGD